MRLTKMFAIAMPVVMAVSAFGAAATFEIDSAHSSAQFKVKHLMISNVRGEFSKVTGTLVYDAANLAASSVEASIPVSTINTREEARDTHLKSPDFFDVAKFPTITFKSKKFASAGPGKLAVTGDLTMHGVTKEVVLAVEGVTGETKGMRGEIRMGASASTKVNRKEFGMTFGRTMEGGGLVVGEEVDITIDLELVKK